MHRAMAASIAQKRQRIAAAPIPAIAAAPSQLSQQLHPCYRSSSIPSYRSSSIPAIAAAPIPAIAAAPIPAIAAAPSLLSQQPPSQLSQQLHPCYRSSPIPAIAAAPSLLSQQLPPETLLPQQLDGHNRLLWKSFSQQFVVPLKSMCHKHFGMARVLAMPRDYTFTLCR
jgi:hypothetical protein